MNYKPCITNYQLPTATTSAITAATHPPPPQLPPPPRICKPKQEAVDKAQIFKVLAAV